jgi:hypothetical protein
MVLKKDTNGLNTMAMLSDLTIPQGFVNSCRLPGPTFTPYGGGGTPSARFGADKLMSNILSFEIKFTGVASPTLGANFWPRPFPGNTDAPYDTLPFDGNFDTFSTQANTPATPPAPAVNWNLATNLATTGTVARPLKQIRITGVQIRLRAYDPKTRSTRQTTLIVNL